MEQQNSGNLIINNLSTFSEVFNTELAYILFFVRLPEISNCLKLILLLHTEEVYYVTTGDSTVLFLQTKNQFVKSSMLHTTSSSQKKYVIILFFHCRRICGLMVSVGQGLFKLDKGNWLVTCEKLKK